MMDPRHRPARIAMGLALALLAGCASDEPAHPWIDLSPESPHQIVEYSGADAGQVVIAMDPTTSRQDALALGALIESQAPAGATVNVRLYNDEETARTWRSSAADQRIAHLLVVVSSNTATGDIEVRWVRPDSLDAPTGRPPGGTAPVPDSLGSMPADSGSGDLR